MTKITPAWQAGYQEALADIAAAFERGGEEEAREWIANNLRPEMRD